MKEHLFKNTAISFIAINIWTSALFFNYLLEEPGLFQGLGTLGFYLYSMFFGIFIAVITLLLRVFVFKKTKSPKLKSNFFYLFAGVFNLNLFLTWLALVLLKIITVEQEEILEIIVCNCLFSLTILTDIFIRKRIGKTENATEIQV